MTKPQTLGYAILLVICCATAALKVRGQSAPARKAAAATYALVPEVYPGDSIEKVIKLFAAEPGMRQEHKELRYYQWWRPNMSVEIWTDSVEHVLSVKFRFKNEPIKTPDGILVGKTSLEKAAVKLGDRFLGESSSIYHLDIDCWAFYIGAKSKESSNWDINYETVECRKGDISEEELRRAPINNMSRQVTGFTEPN